MEFWILFENWTFKNYLKIEVLKIIWKWKFWILNLKIGILKNYFRMEFFKNKLNLKIGILENYLKIEVLKIKFQNWNFGKLFENGIFKNWSFEN